MCKLLTPDELFDKDGSDTREQFMARVYEKLGSKMLQIEFEDIWLENTPHYVLYEDETQNKQMFPQLSKELEPMPEMSDHYLRAEILLYRGDEMTRGHIVAQCCDGNINVMGRAHIHPILDTRMYQVEFAGGKIIEFTTNVIAGSK